MKKITLYILAAVFGIFSVFSCVQPLDNSLRNTTGTPQLCLSVSCMEPATKAYENYPAGENKYNENTITHVDWFIFRDTTRGNDQPWQSGRVTFTSNSDGTTEFPVLSAKDMQAYVGTATSATGYVYTVANYPGEHSELAGSFHDIQEVSFVTSELDVMKQGRFTPLSNFVMTSTVEPFSLTEEVPTAEVHAKLSRQLAKLSLKINIAPYIDEMKAYMNGTDTTRLDYIQTWYPNVEGIRAYMTYANKRATLTPVTSATKAEDIMSYNDDDFFMYNSRGFIPEITYRNDNPKDTAYVAGSPFYSYPMKWETSDSHAPFIKIILEWSAYVQDTTHTTGTYMKHMAADGESMYQTGDSVIVNSHDLNQGTPVDKYQRQKFYYKIAIPSDKNILYSNVWTKIQLYVALLGGMEDEAAVDVIGRYYVVDWNDPNVSGGGNLTAGKYLSLSTPRDTFYIYGGNSIEIPVQSSHDLEVYYNSQSTTDPHNPTATYPIYTSTTAATGRLTYHTSSSSENNYTIKADGRKKVTLTHNLVSNLDSVSSRDIATITYNFRIQHKDNPTTFFKDITVIQYPSIYLETIEPGDAYVDGRKAVRGQSVNTPYYYLRFGYNDNNTDATIYHVHITAFNGKSRYYTPRRQNVTPDEKYEYIITDPRVNAGWGAGDIVAYGPTGTTGGTSWPTTTVQNMMVGTQTANLIAPSFIVSSRWGRPGGGVNYETAQKRCATYQEAGYPAGRWRLPTEAEVYFLFTLQTKGLITELYTTGSGTYGYWASSGYVFGRYWTTGTPDFRTLNNGEVASIRCVYDTWFWGDKPDTRDTYHPGPTI